MQGGQMLLPQPEPAIRLRVRQREPEEGCIRFGLASALWGETATRPDPAGLDQFPRFAPSKAV